SLSNMMVCVLAFRKRFVLVAIKSNASLKIISHFPTIKERNCIEIAFISINLNFFGYNRDILNTFNANNFPILYSKESRM
ncbi:hypothetical protein LZU30_05950, partial [Streptococcus agalactiae]